METKAFQAVVRPRGTQEWQPVLYSGQRFYCDRDGLGQLQQMTAMMSMQFQHNEYSLEEIVIS